MSTKTKNVLLWIAQGLLAALFLFAGGMKLALPAEKLQGPIALPAALVKFIGVCEVAGALGLVLPGLTRIRTELTSLAAAGLVVIMTGATILSAVGLGITAGIFPLVVGVVAASIALGRRPRAASAPGATAGSPAR